jgi:hypothetical protein
LIIVGFVFVVGVTSVDGLVVDGGLVDVGFERVDDSFNEELIAAAAEDATVGADVLFARRRKDLFLK